MARLRWVEVEGFLGFKHRHRINFPQNGLVLIRGESGAGKTSVLQAIAYVIDICPPGYSATQLQCWEPGSPALQVSLCFEENGQEIIFGRGKKTFVKYHDRIVTSAKSVAEEQAKVLGAVPEILAAMTYRDQDSGGLFMSREDSAKKEFLAEVLGLHDIEGVVDAAEAQAKNYDGKLEAGKSLLAYAEQKLAEAVKAQRELDVGVPENPEPLLLEAEAAEADVKLFRTRVEAARMAVAARTSALQAERQQQTQAAEVKLGQTREFLSVLRKKVAELAAEYKARQDVFRTDIAAISKQIWDIGDPGKKIESCQHQLDAAMAGRCHTCGQAWNQQDRVQQLQQEIAACSELPEQKLRLEAQKHSLESQLRAMTPTADAATEKVEKLIAIEQKLIGEISAIRGASDSEFVRLQDEEKKSLQELVGAEARAREAGAVAAAIRTKIAVRARDLDRVQKEIQHQQAEVEKMKGTVSELQTKLFAERDLAAALGREGFLGGVFEEILQEIGAETNKRLSRLSNAEGISIDFRTESVNGKGTVKKTITPVINVRGHETKFKTGISGGQKTSVELAVDLSIVSVIRNRTGVAPSWLCLDEVFTGQPQATKEAAMELLQEFARDRLILVVDHGSEFKSMFTTVIDIESRDGISTVVSGAGE